MWNSFSFIYPVETYHEVKSCSHRSLSISRFRHSSSVPYLMRLFYVSFLAMREQSTKRKSWSHPQSFHTINCQFDRNWFFASSLSLPWLSMASWDTLRASVSKRLLQCCKTSSPMNRCGNNWSNFHLLFVSCFDTRSWGEGIYSTSLSFLDRELEA